MSQRGRAIEFNVQAIIRRFYHASYFSNKNVKILGDLYLIQVAIVLSVILKQYSEMRYFVELKRCYCCYLLSSLSISERVYSN